MIIYQAVFDYNCFDHVCYSLIVIIELLANYTHYSQTSFHINRNL